MRLTAGELLRLSVTRAPGKPAYQGITEESGRESCAHLRRVINDDLAADVTRACTSGGMTRPAAADAFKVSEKTIERICCQQPAPPDEYGDT